MSFDPTQVPQARVAADWLRQSHATIALTGAGISTDSGIPDFRSPKGVWARQKPVWFDEFLESTAAREELWRQKSLAFLEFHAAEPNVGHGTLARWERSGRIRRVVTQNIDGLHARAGSRQPVELHGSAREVVCLDCCKRYPAGPLARRYRETSVVPDCPECHGLLKWAIVLFGEPLDPAVWAQAEALADDCDVFLAIGSSLVVEPAASLPRRAKQRGARLIIINGEPTPLDDLADLVIHAGISEALAAIDAEL